MAGEFPAPKEGFVVAHFLVVSDQDRSRAFYQRVFDGEVVLERDPVIMPERWRIRCYFRDPDGHLIEVGRPLSSLLRHPTRPPLKSRDP